MRRAYLTLLLIAFEHVAYGSQDTNGPNGINSGGLGLTGSGIGIGQVEPGRPGKPAFDMAANTDPTTTPEAVFLRNGAAVADMNVDNHAQQVASVMISTDAIRTGVATAAKLYSSADNGMAPNFDQTSAIAAQHVAIQNGGDIRAINMSFGNALEGAHILDGESLLTLFVDWSANIHDVLYVVAGNEGGGGIPVPTDDYNGITVAYSEKVGMVYQQVGALNYYGEDAFGDRTSIDILASGTDVAVRGLGGALSTETGTSFAAPHVTGTVALLQQFADPKVMAMTPHWDGDARRHEVMKAVMMNSADKIKDDGMIAPIGRFQGMERTVTDQGANNWLMSTAFTDEEIPLDMQMGAGHLNAKRALQQFRNGEMDADTPSVPIVGWDFGMTTGDDDINKYPLAQKLRAGS